MRVHLKKQIVIPLGVTLLAALVTILLVMFYVEQIYQFAYPLKGGGTLKSLFSRQPIEIFLALMFFSLLYVPPVVFVSWTYSKFPIFCQHNTMAVVITLVSSLLTSLWVCGFVTLNCGEPLYLSVGRTVFTAPFFVPWLLGAHLIRSTMSKMKHRNLWKIGLLVFAGSTALICLLSICFGSPPSRSGEILSAYWWFLLSAILGFSSLITSSVSDVIIRGIADQ